MNLRANAERKFLLKYLFIGLICLAFGCWATYDGFVKYPNQIPRAQAWEELKQKIESTEALSDANLGPMWEGIAKENGWSTKRLKKDESVASVQGKISYQYLFMAIGFCVGIPCLIWYLRNKSCWIESTSDGLRSSNGDELKLQEIVQFDKKKWEKKGIGIVHYKTKDGLSKKFIIDDLKHDRIITDKIVAWMESIIPEEMIVNGPTEAQTMAKKNEAKDPKPAASIES